MTATTTRQPLLFRWSVQDGLGANGALVARSYRTALTLSLSKTSPKWVADRNGLYLPSAPGVVPVGWVGGAEALVLEAAAATNIVLHNRDLTNAAWTKTNATAAKTQTGIDGVASSASLLTATAGNGTCLQSVTLASSVRRQSAFVKRVTGSGTVQMTTDNGATWTAITVTSAWTRVTIPEQTLANPVVGFRLVTNGDAIAVDMVQNETGNVETSPIPTTTVAVTRAADVCYAPFLPVPQEMTLYVRGVELMRADQVPTADAWILSIAAAAGTTDPKMGIYRNQAAAGYRTQHDPATVTATIAIGTAATVNDVVELRCALSSGGAVTAGVSINSGTEATNGPTTAQPLASAWADTRLYLGALGTTSGGAFAFRQIAIAAGTKTLAEMRALAEVG